MTRFLPGARSGAISGAVLGAGAGAAGTTALNAVTYLDMAVRGRPASSTPEQTVERMSDATGVAIPGRGDARHNRIAGLAPLLGVAVGVATGAVIGVARAAGAASGAAPTIAASTLLAMLTGNVPMTAARVTNPQEWSTADWLADVVPHVGYGVVTGLVLCQMQPAKRGRR